jgi:hypothetical protein
MKKMFKATALLLALLAAFALVGCSNSSGSGGGDSDWQNVTNLSDMVGTWVYSANAQGLNEKDIYTVGSGYATSFEADVDYSAASPVVQAAIIIAIGTLEAGGYTCNNDVVAKKLTVTKSYTASEFTTFVLGGGVKINAAKDKVKIKDVQGNEAVFVKQ